MVRKVEDKNHSGKPIAELHQCEECSLHYLDPELAKKCEEWCRAHKSCNLEIIQYAIENKRGH